MNDLSKKRQLLLSDNKIRAEKNKAYENLYSASALLASVCGVKLEYDTVLFFLAPFYFAYNSALQGGVNINRLYGLATLRQLHSIATGLPYSLTNYQIQVGCVSKNDQHHVVQSGYPNMYERLTYKICGVKFAPLFFDEACLPDFSSAESRKREVMEKVDESSEEGRFIGCLPLSVFYYLWERDPEDYRKKAHAKNLLLDARISLDEDYCYFVALAKEKGVRVIGQPHGAYYCQTQNPTAFELTERMLSDLFMTPSWEASSVKLPNFRVSKNLYLGLFKKLKSIKLERQKIVFVLPFLNNGIDDNQNFPRAESVASRIDSACRTLKVEGRIHIKVHPANQDKSSTVIGQIGAVLESYLSITEIVEGSCRDLFVSFEKVVFLTPYSTGILEAVNASCLVYVSCHKKDRLNPGYRNFLARFNALQDQSSSPSLSLFLIDKSLVRSAYFASYLYPFKWAFFLKRA